MKSSSWLLLAAAAAIFWSCAGRLSAAGESCAYTGHCVVGSVCLEQQCVADAGVRGVSNAHLDTLEDFAKAVVAAVRSGQQSRLQALSISREDMVTFVEEAAKGAPHPLDAAEKETIITRHMGKMGRFDEYFAMLKGDFERHKVDHKTLHYVRIARGNTQNMGPFTAISGDLEIIVTVDDPRREMRLKVEDAFKGPRGWLLTHPEVELEAR